ncbi:uncharacterized protein LOC122289299 [Carya illinoinensis]|uniref:uncharacterized protein LOC122289299 n=1 Tax=Carya illinoinensis TaxID=32201 RepID=UPI001C724FF3|nr:uncharacterized protein LOC122289299 [Carya illinoinensis]
MIVAERPVNREAFKTTMSKVWKCKSWIQFSEVGTNKFLIEFNHKQDLQQVISGRPWSFDRWLVCLQPFEGHRSINEVLFHTEVFWVQVFNMPFASMTQEVGTQIAEHLGRVLTVQTDERGIGWGKCMRMRVEVDISKALQRGIFLTFEGKKTWVFFKYERLPNFCFKCGVIKHDQKGCNEASTSKDKLQYGSWMRAPAVNEHEVTRKRYGNETCHQPEEEQPRMEEGKVRDEGQNCQEKPTKENQHSKLPDVDKAETKTENADMLSKFQTVESFQFPI